MTTYRKKLRRRMSAKSRRRRVRKLKANSAYPVGYEVARIDNRLRREGINKYADQYVFAVYRVIVHPAGRRLIWAYDRDIKLPDEIILELNRGWKQGMRKAIAWCQLPYMEVNGGDTVPTLQSEVMRLLAE